MDESELYDNATNSTNNDENEGELEIENFIENESDLEKELEEIFENGDLDEKWLNSLNDSELNSANYNKDDDQGVNETELNDKLEDDDEDDKEEEESHGFFEHFFDWFSFF